MWPGSVPIPRSGHRALGLCQRSLARGIGRPSKLLRRDLQHQPIAAKALALRLPAEAWQTITWREGAADWLSARFARQRVRPAHRDTLLTVNAEEKMHQRAGVKLHHGWVPERSSVA